MGSKFWHNCKCGPLGPKNAGGRAQCLCWGTARSDRAANHALEPTTCSEHGVPKFDAPEHASEHGLFRSKKMLFLPAPEQKNTVFACSGALFEPCLVLRSICHRNKANFASHTALDCPLLQRTERIRILFVIRIRIQDCRWNLDCIRIRWYLLVYC